MTKKYNKVILDTDFCIKLGGIENYNFLEKIVGAVTEKAYMHEYLYNNELLTPRIAKDQIDALKDAGVLELVGDSCLSNTEKQLFDITVQLLKTKMYNPDHKRKNMGEINSLAYAKIKQIPIFMSDEKEMQNIADQYLNTGITNIECIRICDIIEMAKNKEIDITRKEAKLIHLKAGYSKERFEEMWPKPAEDIK